MSLRRSIVPSILVSVVRLAKVVTKEFVGPPGLAVVPTQNYTVSERTAVHALGLGATPCPP